MIRHDAMRNRSRQRRAKFPSRVVAARCAFTLIEILLVLGLLLLIAGLAMPSLMGTLRAGRVRYAADDLRNVCAQARVRAMRTGHTLALNYSETGYRVQAIDAGDGEATDAPGYAEEYQLPEGIRLTSASLENSDRDESQGMSSATTANSAQQGMPIFVDLNGNPAAATGGMTAYFYPDGSSSTMEFFLENDRGTSYVVLLRGVTGTALVLDGAAGGQAANPYLINRGATPDPNGGGQP